MKQIMSGGGKLFYKIGHCCMLIFADANLDGDHRYMLFSATFPKRLQALATQFLAKDHIHVSIGRTGSAHVNVKQQVCALGGSHIVSH